MWCGQPCGVILTLSFSRVMYISLESLRRTSQIRDAPSRVRVSLHFVFSFFRGEIIQIRSSPSRPNTIVRKYFTLVTFPFMAIIIILQGMIEKGLFGPVNFPSPAGGMESDCDRRGDGWRMQTRWLPRGHAIASRNATDVFRLTQIMDVVETIEISCKS